MKGVALEMVVPQGEELEQEVNLKAATQSILVPYKDHICCVLTSTRLH